MIKHLLVASLAALALTLPLSAAEDGWTSLFDGKTLEGWTQKNGKATYRVQDGAIVGKTEKKSPNSFLCTNEEFADFELEFEVRLINNELNSGCQIRSQTKPAKGNETFGRVNGPQVEIEASGSSGAESGYVYGEACGGWMTPKDKLVKHKHFKDGELESLCSIDFHLKEVNNRFKAVGL